MSRLIYRSVTALAVLSGASLIIAPIWDCWFYRPAQTASAGPAQLAAITRPVVTPGTAPRPFVQEAEAPVSWPGGNGGEGQVLIRPGSRPPVEQMVVRAEPGGRAGNREPAVPAPEALSLAPVAERPRPAERAGRNISGRASERASARASVSVLPQWTVPASGPGATRTPVAAPPVESREFEDANANRDTGAGASSQSAPPEPSPADQLARIHLVPSSTSLTTGQRLLVQVVLDAGRTVTSVPFHLRFSPEVLEYVGGREGSIFQATSLQPILLASVSPEAPGDLAVGLAVLGSSGSLTGPGQILVLEFSALGAGQSTLAFERASVRGPTGEAVPAEFVPSAITVR